MPYRYVRQWYVKYLYPNISYHFNCPYRCKLYAVIQSTYVVVITGGLHHRESADKETNRYEGECASRAVHLQPPHKIIENVGANLEFH